MVVACRNEANTPPRSGNGPGIRGVVSGPRALPYDNLSLWATAPIAVGTEPTGPDATAEQMGRTDGSRGSGPDGLGTHRPRLGPDNDRIGDLGQDRVWRTRFKPITDDPMRVADQPCRITSTGGKMPWSDGGLNVCGRSVQFGSRTSTTDPSGPTPLSPAPIVMLPHRAW